MALDESWYEVVKSEDLDTDVLLEQGDLLLQCPRYVVHGLDAWPLPEEAELGIGEEVVSAVILTQTCDLANNKVNDVLLGEVVLWPNFENRSSAYREMNKKARKSYRKALVNGHMPSLSLLHESREQVEMDFGVVDFQAVFTLPKEVLLLVAAHQGHRLRLRPPYKEHLAQAFARFFMRVGLPHTAHSFIESGQP